MKKTSNPSILAEKVTDKVFGKCVVSAAAGTVLVNTENIIELVPEEYRRRVAVWIVEMCKAIQEESE